MAEGREILTFVGNEVPKYRTWVFFDTKGMAICHTWVRRILGRVRTDKPISLWWSTEKLPGYRLAVFVEKEGGPPAIQFGKKKAKITTYFGLQDRASSRGLLKDGEATLYFKLEQ